MSTTREEALPTIQKIANKLAPNYVFGYYDVDDIKQEAILMGLEALSRYDESRPLENFMRIHIKNRLITFKRDNFCRYNHVCGYCNNKSSDCQHCKNHEKYRESKKNIIEPLDISNIDDESEPNMHDKFDLINEIIKKEINFLIDKYLPIEYRTDYLKVRDGVYVSKKRRNEIYEIVKDIIKEHGDEER